MAYKKKTAREKLSDDKDLPKIVKVEGKMKKVWGSLGEKCVIAPAKDYDEMMKNVKKGELITINQMREKLAKKYKADFTCPITAGIFVNIAAHAAEEDAAEGRKEITPYWRTLKSNGELNEKYPEGIERQAERLKKEGHVIEKKGKKMTVKEFEKKLVE